jgi:hypothetical protein
VTEIIEHADGRFIVTEPAGGTGGGATSTATRVATFEEIKDHLEVWMRHLETQLEAAKERHQRHVGLPSMSGEHETIVYQDGTAASGPGPLPRLSPEEQAAAQREANGIAEAQRAAASEAAAAVAEHIRIEQEQAEHAQSAEAS